MNDVMMTFADLAHAVNGTLTSVSGAGVIRGVTTDSRAISPGDLFIPLSGEKFDGHDFIDTAAKAGATCALVHKELPSDPGIPLIRVADTRLALGQLARWWRDRYRGKLAALTGSNGKTTVKEMTAAILRAASGDASAVLATEGNFNNDIGMPLTLLKLRDRHQYAVIEMGMNHLGEIGYLTDIAKPDAALINNAHRAHVGELGSIENIAQAKGEIFAGVKENGVVLINADDAFAGYWTQLAVSKRQLTFGLHNGDVRCDYTETPAGTAIRLTTPAGKIESTLHVPGEHNIRNATAAAAIAIALDIAPEAIAQGLASYTGTKGRLQKKAGLNGAVVIDDTYNANPDSMAAAIAVLAKTAGSKIFVMGDMGELGEDAPAMHAEIGVLAKRAGIDKFFGLGDLTTRAVEAFGSGGRHLASVAEVGDTLRPIMQKDVVVLVKGSRFMRMERVVEAITMPVEH